MNMIQVAISLWPGRGVGRCYETSLIAVPKKPLCGANFAKALGFKAVPTSPMVPTPVLMVYPAKNSTFQQAVVALAELLQWHGGCSVAVDMWQQGKIAELGPMRWLAEQVKAADRVLIVCPQETPSDSPPNHSLPEPSIPAGSS
ncbi:Interleukin-17 receptor B [Nibea albiflora]|uniref:Interleukin-17 receptor B n=1 Tax=Nibea albiflora TaxID=240163 RepID=A0ACB7EL91_NIBAL|nr:Interleukin-17 receptor B [Nibea albiflora]